MKLLYSVFDVQSKAYGLLIAENHDAVATRNFAAAVMEPGSTLNKFPQDFELHRVGEFHDVTGEFRLSASADVPEFFPFLSPRLVPLDKPFVVTTAAAVLAMQASGPQLAKEA